MRDIYATNHCHDMNYVQYACAFWGVQRSRLWALVSSLGAISGHVAIFFQRYLFRVECRASWDLCLRLMNLFAHCIIFLRLVFRSKHNVFSSWFLTFHVLFYVKYQIWVGNPQRTAALIQLRLHTALNNKQTKMEAICVEGTRRKVSFDVLVAHCLNKLFGFTAFFRFESATKVNNTGKLLIVWLAGGRQCW